MPTRKTSTTASRPRTAAKTPTECVIMCRIDGNTVINDTFPFKEGLALQRWWTSYQGGMKKTKTARSTVRGAAAKR